MGGGELVGFSFLSLQTRRRANITFNVCFCFSLW